jgi:hypothetical protein
MASFLLSKSRMDKKRWRISLREALWLMLWVGMLLAIWRLTDPRATKVCINPRHADAAIREELLSYTPKGTPVADALEFIMTKLDHEEPVWSDFPYVKTIEARTGKPPPVKAATTERTVTTAVGESFAPPLIDQKATATKKKVRVIVNTRAVAFVAAEVVEAEWRFDADDHLEEITIGRYVIGP